jgi:hypothetical protein
MSFGSSVPPQPSAQQDSGRRIEGTVIDSQGLPIPGARITLVMPQSSSRQTIASPVGAFTLGDLPASVAVLSAEDIRQSPAVVADDLLRQIPPFRLFR